MTYNLKDAKFYIDYLNLKVHPEGGYFSEIYRSDILISNSSLPYDFTGDRNVSTSIYFLLDNSNVSKFHRLKSDEIWHFFDGKPIYIYTISDNGKLDSFKLGRDLENGEAFQIVIPKNTWFGAHLEDYSGFALVGCTVAPGFDYNDFELAKRKDLLNLFPEYNQLICQLT